METRSYVADELLERLDGLLADVRELHTEVHQLSTSAAEGTAAPADSKQQKAKEKPKNKPKNKQHKKKNKKKKSKARND